MKILLPAKKIIEIRPYWTVSALEKLVGCDGIDKSPFSSPTFAGRPLYDMEKVIAAEQTDAFCHWQERRKKALSQKKQRGVDVF